MIACVLFWSHMQLRAIEKRHNDASVGDLFTKLPAIYYKNSIRWSIEKVLAASVWVSRAARAEDVKRMDNYYESITKWKARIDNDTKRRQSLLKFPVSPLMDDNRRTDKEIWVWNSRNSNLRKKKIKNLSSEELRRLFDVKSAPKMCCGGFTGNLGSLKKLQQMVLI